MPMERCGRKQLVAHMRGTHQEVGVALKLVITVMACPMPATTIGICPPAPMMVICPAPASFTSLEWITATGLELMVVRVLALLPGTQVPLSAPIGLRLSTVASTLGT